MTIELKRRRSLTNVGGEIVMHGDRDAAQLLAQALDVPPDPAEDAADRAHVHGFHAYPARAHPVTVRRLIEGFAPPGGVVLDPFCGSGTVLVEAQLAGREAIGTDLNPIAVLLAKAKTRHRLPGDGAAMVEAARGVAAFADARRKAKAGATRRLAKEDLAIFAPHVVLELDGLRAGIEQASTDHRADLWLVLSAILVKVSQTRGDTTDAPSDKRIAAGYPSRLFVKKAEDFARRLQELTDALPEGKRPRVKVKSDDATVLKSVDDGAADAIVTSPPYVATYDYLAHHELRMRWLDLDERALARGELGAKRHYERLGPRDARAEWQHQLAELLRALARVARRRAPIVLLIADSAVRAPYGGAEALRAEELVAAAAADASRGRGGRRIDVLARASQVRPHFHGPTSRAFLDRPRAEHAIVLQRG